MTDNEEYAVEVYIEDGSWENTEFAHCHAEQLKEMGYRPVFFEDTQEVALLREVQADE